MNVLFLTASLLAVDPSVADIRDRIRAWRGANESAIVRELAELTAIPNVASDTPNIRKNADHLLRMLEKRGFKPKLLESPGSPPGVFAEKRFPGATKTLGLYAHYDGQPVVLADWKTDPWKPTLRTGKLEDGAKDVPIPERGPIDPSWRLYARSASDDKAPIVTLLAALDALAANQRTPVVNLVIFLDGEEEAGSPHMRDIFEKNRDILHADLWLVLDGPDHASGRKQVAFGARGVTTLELTTYGPSRSLHSGHYGNWAPNPAMRMASVLASMRDDDGRILIDGFMKSVRPLTKSERAAIADVPDMDAELRKELALGATEAGNAKLIERIHLPALNIRAISAGPSSNAANAIVTQAWASIDFRLVPNLTPEEVHRLVEKHLEKRGYFVVHDVPDRTTLLAHPKVIRVVWTPGGYPSQRTSLDAPSSKAIIAVVRAASDAPIVVIPTQGGSLPANLFPEVLKSDVISVPTVNYDNSQHAANENVRIGHLWDAIEIFGVMLVGLRTDW